MRVLSSMEEKSTTTNNKTIAPVPIKRVKLNEELEDLNENNASELKGAELNLTHVDRYFQEIKSYTNKASRGSVALKTQDPKLLCQNTLNEIFEWNLDIKKLNNPTLAISILIDLSPGSQLMQSNAIQNLKGNLFY